MGTDNLTRSTKRQNTEKKHI